MSVHYRTAAITTAIVVGTALCLAAPTFFKAAFADEPATVMSSARQLFAAPFDPKTLLKFTVTADDSVSTKVQRTRFVNKIGFGQRSVVSIVTTASGTYSSDALTSPYVRYPGIDVTPTDSDQAQDQSQDQLTFGTATTPRGTRTWTSVTRGSFTYFNYVFKPARG